MLNDIPQKLANLPGWVLGVIVLVGVGIVGGGAYAGYRTYDYVEHDNEFCLSCHLMVEPYEVFARSAHRDLGCKACHKPTFAARSQMALTQIIENPDSIQAHAEVPDEKCADCHIEGDPDEWALIRSSAGHRIHFESQDSSLQGLNCVACHASSVHQFTATSETCAQSGCHTDSDIQLGRMGDLTIHCVACHSFSEPVPEDQPLEAVTAAVSPNAEECLSCHVMRTLVSMPDDEPHDASCGACHQPHEQTTPEEAVESCATADCHSQPDTLTPFHRGLERGVLADCTDCHDAHGWEADGNDCLSCHQDVFEDGSGGEGQVIASARGGVAPETDPREEPGWAAARAAGLVHPSGPSGPHDGFPAAVRPARLAASPVQQSDTAFVHAQHREVDCLSCHVTEESHGQLTVTGLTDCRSCHHTEPVAAVCADCHQPSEQPTETYRLSRSMTFTVASTPVSRALPFEHEAHPDLDCAECHTEGLALSAEAVDCASCHEDHHEPEARCASCHVPAADEDHPVEQVHVGCSGAGCHEEVPVPGVPRTRPFCEGCHQDMMDHRPEENCAECHQLPAPRAVEADR